MLTLDVERKDHPKMGSVKDESAFSYPRESRDKKQCKLVKQLRKRKQMSSTKKQHVVSAMQLFPTHNIPLTKHTEYIRTHSWFWFSTYIVHMGRTCLTLVSWLDNYELPGILNRRVYKKALLWPLEVRLPAYAALMETCLRYCIEPRHSFLPPYCWLR